MVAVDRAPAARVVEDPFCLGMGRDPSLKHAATRMSFYMEWPCVEWCSCGRVWVRADDEQKPEEVYTFRERLTEQYRLDEGEGVQD